MKYNKPPLSTVQHISKLSERGLIIDDNKSALHYLNTIGYYRLSAYFIPFEQRSDDPHSRNHDFEAETNFNDILNIYIFDRKLRLIVMEAIERIEVAIRTQWANALAQSTSDPHAFMAAINFKDPWSHQKMLAKVSSNLAGSGEVFVSHYKKRYKEPFLPPIWAMVETLTFGELSKWFTNTSNNKIKKEIALSVGIPTVEILQGVMHTVALIRNICAHHGRLWNRRIVKPLPYIKKLQSMLQTEIGINQPKKELFNYLVVICHMMKSIHPSTSWSQRLISHIDSLTVTQRLAMGFPENRGEYNDFFKNSE